jgi:outer membrane protein
MKIQKIIKAVLLTSTVSLLSIALSSNSYAGSSKPEKSKSKLSTSSIAHAAALKYGVVDYMTVFQMVPQGKDKLAELQKNLKPQVDALQKQQLALQSQMKKLQKDAPTLTDAQKQSQEKVLLQKQADFQTQVKALQDGETAKEQKAATDFQKAVKKAVDIVGKKDGYDLIFNSQATPYSQSGSDVSHEVIAEMKVEYKKWNG